MEPSTKAQPQNTDAEASLLGAILIDPDAIVKIADHIIAEDFFDAKHLRIYEAVTQLYEKRSPIDVLTLADQLKNNGYLDLVGGPSYLTELTNFVPTAAHAEQYADIIAGKAVRRRMMAAAQDIAVTSSDETRSVREISEEAKTNLFNVHQQHVKKNVHILQANQRERL